MAESLESEEKEFDLYDDLIDPFFSLQKEEDNEAAKELEIHRHDHQAELQALQTLNRQLSTTNGALKKNISCLFKTATMEVERKNAEITSLKKQIDNLQQLIKHISSKLASTQAPHDLPHSPAANGHHAQDQLMQVERGDQPSNSSCVQQLSHNETLHTSFRPSPNSHQSKRVHSPSCSRNSFTKETHLPLHINSESDENHFSMVASSSSPTDASNHSRQSPHSCRQTHQWNRGLKRLPMTDGHNSSTRRRLNGNFDKESPLGPQLQAPSLPGRTGSPSSHNRSLHLETSGSEISLTSQLMEEGEVSDCSIEGTSSVSLGHNVHRDSNAGRHLIAYGQDSRNSPTQHCLHSPLHYHTHSTGHGRQKTPSRAQHTIPSHHKDNSSHKQNSDRSPHHSRLYHNSSRDRYSYKH